MLLDEGLVVSVQVEHEPFNQEGEGEGELLQAEGHHGGTVENEDIDQSGEGEEQVNRGVEDVPHEFEFALRISRVQRGAQPETRHAQFGKTLKRPMFQFAGAPASPLFRGGTPPRRGTCCVQRVNVIAWVI